MRGRKGDNRGARCDTQGCPLPGQLEECFHPLIFFPPIIFTDLDAFPSRKVILNAIRSDPSALLPDVVADPTHTGRSLLRGG